MSSRRRSADQPSRATITDVAREAGVHASTVSRALNPATRGMVTEAVAARVAEVAERLGWRPSTLAAGLRTRRSRSIGILVPDLVNPVFPPIVRAAEERLAEAGYVTFVANTDTDPTREAMIVERMAAHLVDGLMLASATETSRALQICERFGIPTVLVNRRQPGSRHGTVVHDDLRGMALVIAHLHGLGHRRIAHLAGPPGVSTASDRLRGFRAALTAHGLDAEAAPVVIAAAYSREAGRRAMEALLERGGFTAVASANDMLCLGIYDALEAAGLAVGRDISVTGFNDMPFVDRIHPPLTTVRIQHAEMGRCAADLLLAELVSGGQGEREIVLQPELVVRSSTAPPARS
ncbi:LacI family DNA-binding transcriptional regulator [Falsiroseomonas oryziterrae]|uniref:LacI family DNA-binding transcriptional regulator n=1 Tax=Falsiroseomonas oryziterrae TaxID=2911368 RepID=UPI001F160AF8|nr:LacI family DNA-binding transcriptional regulator [Roseomonas sp. NPKOSM-4]